MYARFGRDKVLVNNVRFGDKKIVVNGWYSITPDSIESMAEKKFDEVEIGREIYTREDYFKLEKLFMDM